MLDGNPLLSVTMTRAPQIKSTMSTPKAETARRPPGSQRPGDQQETPGSHPGNRRRDGELKVS